MEKLNNNSDLFESRDFLEEAIGQSYWKFFGLSIW